jgi:cruciform cutting endonuclease 1
LTRIGSASSGTKSTLAERFQRDLRRIYNSHPRPPKAATQLAECGRKIRVVSIDMGIKNLAFCDAEVAYPSSTSTARYSLDATMKILRWKKLDLVGGPKPTTRVLDGGAALQDSEEDGTAAEEDDNQFSPSVLSRTAYKFITEEVLSANPDVVLIEKQRWRSGGGSAVQQWTVRVNTLEAMLWAILETVKRTQQPRLGGGKALDVRAVDPKRVGQYWLGQHARALSERDEEALAHDMSALSVEDDESDDVGEADSKATKKPSRSKAEKSAKIAILRSWLAEHAMSTIPSTPTRMPCIAFSVDFNAEPTRQALLPKAKALRKKKSSKSSRATGADVELAEELPAAEIKKLDDITDCFLQAAAWVAWDLNKFQLLAVLGSDGTKSPSLIDEAEILRMIEEIGGV